MTIAIIRNVIGHGSIVTLNGVDKERGQPYQIHFERGQFSVFAAGNRGLAFPFTVKHTVLDGTDLVEVIR